LTAASWGENDVYSWASGQLFAAAAKAANMGDNPTAAQVTQGLSSLHGETLGGLAPPLTFASGQNHEIYCEFVQGVSNNQFVQPQGDNLSCAPQAPLAPVIAAVVKAAG
jgi:branched-chain amino acid transport system substrate-binding protein